LSIAVPARPRPTLWHAGGTLERRCDGPRSATLERDVFKGASGRGGVVVSIPTPAVGTVAGLWRYPVKSMAPEPLAAAELSWAGVAGDRRWGFVRPGAGRNGFPWHTIREHPMMCRYVARLLDPERPDKSEVEVRTPAGDTLRVHDPALAAELGPGVRVMRLDRGLYDSMPVSLISTATVADLCRPAQVPADPLRFRPNVLVAPAAGGPFVEDDWVGSVVLIGAAAMRIDAHDSRCTIVNVDPGSGRPDAGLLKQIGQRHRGRAGVYGTVVRPGLVRIGDPVRLAPAT
jgi:uncharacterized protein